MSNSFPKVSPDGRWIVFVGCRNGLLMRPDSKLYIIPAAGGEPRLMRANLPPMNSWHSFSPNGRWMAFSSKSRFQDTQVALQHLADNGQESVAIHSKSPSAEGEEIGAAPPQKGTGQPADPHRKRNRGQSCRKHSRIR